MIAIFYQNLAISIAAMKNKFSDVQKPIETNVRYLVVGIRYFSVFGCWHSLQALDSLLTALLLFIARLGNSGIHSVLVIVKSGDIRRISFMAAYVYALLLLLFSIVAFVCILVVVASLYIAHVHRKYAHLPGPPCYRCCKGHNPLGELVGN